MRKISLFIAISLDGYIAKPNNDLSFLKIVEKEGENSSNSIIALINLAKVNDRLLPEDADILRKEVKSKKIYEEVCITN